MCQQICRFKQSRKAEPKVAIVLISGTIGVSRKSEGWQERTVRP